MIKINLLPWREKQRWRKTNHLTVYFITTIFAIACTTLTITEIINTKIKQQTNAYNRLNQFINQQAPTIIKIRRKLQQHKQLKNQLKQKQQTRKKNTPAIQLMIDAAKELPNGITLEKIQWQPQRQTILGTSKSQGQLLRYSRRLNPNFTIDTYHNKKFKITHHEKPNKI